MHVDFLSDLNLSGYSLEFAAKILLRRFRKNNFIFQFNQHASINELITKYRLDITDHEWILEGMKCDLIEFIFDDLKTRKVKEIRLYEVKVNRQSILRPDLTVSSFKFYSEISASRKASVQYIIITPRPHWSFEWDIIDFGKVEPHVYSTASRKTFRPRIYAPHS